MSHAIMTHITAKGCAAGRCHAEVRSLDNPPTCIIIVNLSICLVLSEPCSHRRLVVGVGDRLHGSARHSTSAALATGAPSAPSNVLVVL